METNLKSKEQLFCQYYVNCRNGAEAAGKCGYHFPAKKGTKLLERQDIREYIKTLEDRKFATEVDIAAGYRRLAFGCVADAVSLLFDEEITAEKLAAMNLFNVSEIKRAKGGAIEIKFFDRLKAMDKLESFYGNSNSGENALMNIIAESAKKAGESNK